jgi:hypothetical protein
VGSNPTLTASIRISDLRGFCRIFILDESINGGTAPITTGPGELAISRTSTAVDFSHPIGGSVSRPLSIRDGELLVMDDEGKLTVLAQNL